MSLEFWSSAFKWAGYFGAIFVVISTIGLGIVNDKLDAKKDQKIDDLVSGKNLLIESVDNYKKQVEDKQRQIDDLSKKAVNAERGVSEIFDFNGARRTTDGGRISVMAGPESRAFLEMNHAINATDWGRLIDLCNAAIESAPKWWTSYYFRSFGYIKVGQFQEAIADLNVVMENVGDSADYAQASEWLTFANKKIATLY